MSRTKYFDNSTPVAYFMQDLLTYKIYFKIQLWLCNFWNEKWLALSPTRRLISNQNLLVVTSMRPAEEAKTIS